MQQKRYDYIDLLRFVAGLAIVATHIFNLGVPWGSYPFSVAWIFVEFFFIISGYFTTAHFAKRPAQSLDQSMGTSLSYTFRKFSRYFPYSTIVVVTAYVILNVNTFSQGLGKVLTGFRDMIFEACYLSCAVPRGMVSVTIWYLSAMFLVFPVYCCLLQLRSRNWLKWIAFIVPVLYYGFFGVAGTRAYPHDMLRAFSCMLIGTCIFLFQGDINKLLLHIKSKALLTIIEVGCFLFVLCVAYRNKADLTKLCLAAFVILVAIFFSGQSYTSRVSSTFFRWLGKLSLPMFLWNWTIGSGIRTFLPDMPFDSKVVLYFVLSLVIPIATMLIVEGIQKMIAKAKERRLSSS